MILGHSPWKTVSSSDLKMDDVIKLAEEGRFVQIPSNISSELRDLLE